jgi:hypothetical protein
MGGKLAKITVKPVLRDHLWEKEKVAYRRSSSRYGERFQLWLKCDTWYC